MAFCLVRGCFLWFCTVPTFPLVRWGVRAPTVESASISARGMFMAVTTASATVTRSLTHSEIHTFLRIVILPVPVGEVMCENSIVNGRMTYLTKCLRNMM